MWTLLWQFVCSCLDSFTVRQAHPEWNTWIKETNTIDKYKTIVSSMFLDNVFNKGRLLVLETFTKDIQQQHPNISEDIEQYKIFIISQYLHC